MRLIRDRGRVAGLWYLCLVFLGPVRLIYIPHKLFISDDGVRTAANLLAHETLFRVGVLSELAAAVVLIFMTLAFFRLFERVDRSLALQVVVFGGIMPALINFVSVVSDGGALLCAQGESFLGGFTRAQQVGLMRVFLSLGSFQMTAAELLWGIWLLPLAALLWKSRYLPRWIAGWLAINGVVYVSLCLIGELRPEAYSKAFVWSQPALFAELAVMLWLVVRGARTGTPKLSGSTL